MADSTKQIVPPFSRDDIKDLAEEASQDPNSSFGYEVITLDLEKYGVAVLTGSATTISPSDFDETLTRLYDYLWNHAMDINRKPILLRAYYLNEDINFVGIATVCRNSLSLTYGVINDEYFIYIWATSSSLYIDVESYSA